MKATEREGDAGRNSVSRIELPRCRLREHFDLFAQRARLSEPISKLRRRLTKRLRGVDQRIAKFLQRTAQKKPRAKEAELDLRACLRPIRLRHDVSRARATIESSTLAEFTPRACRVLDAKFPAEMEDQDSGAVRQFTAATKRRPAFVISVKRARCRESRAPSGSSRATRQEPASESCSEIVMRSMTSSGRGRGSVILASLWSNLRSRPKPFGRSPLMRGWSVRRLTSPSSSSSHHSST